MPPLDLVVVDEGGGGGDGSVFCLNWEHFPSIPSWPSTAGPRASGDVCHRETTSAPMWVDNNTSQKGVIIYRKV